MNTPATPYRPGRWQALRYEDKCRYQRDALDAAAADAVEVCRLLPGVRRLYVYGSYARNAVGPLSDLDLLIVRDTNLPRGERAQDIHSALTVPVSYDLTVVRPDEFLSDLPRTSFGVHILREARLLASFDPPELLDPRDANAAR